MSLAHAAIADFTRRAIPERPARGEAALGGLATPFRLRLPTLSEHIRVLQGAGLLSRRRRTQWRPCGVDPEPIRELSEWLWEYRRVWSAQPRHLDTFLVAIRVEGPTNDRENPRLHRRAASPGGGLRHALAAPWDQVSRAGADPGLTPRWRDPAGPTTTVEAMEGRRGGRWRISQVDRDGNRNLCFGVNHSGEAPVLLVRTFEYAEAAGPVVLETVEFPQVGRDTEFTTRSGFQWVVGRDEMARSAREVGRSRP